MADPVAQYLSRYAEPEIDRASELTGRFSHAVVVPAFHESTQFVDPLLETASVANAVAIVVVNATEAAPAEALAANAAVLDRLAGRPGVIAIDRTSEGRRLPSGHGVGLARKIGCDVALAAWVDGRVDSPWIHSTDADVTLPAAYFSTAAGAPEDSAAIAFPFRHDTPDSGIGRALRLYEASLRYYVLGLEHAGSAYAFHTIGSALAVHAAAYAKVRGVPPREAGEDFYLLNKLAKVGSVWRAQCEPIRIAARRSRRVPFGTGAATDKIAAALSAGEPFNVYHPDSFSCVREAIRAVETGGAPSDRTSRALGALGAPAAIDKARRGTTSETAFAARMRQWFDAFRTLKLIHHLRDSGLAPIPIETAVARAPFCPPAIDSLAEAERAIGPGPRGVFAAQAA